MITQEEAHIAGYLVYPGDSAVCAQCGDGFSVTKELCLFCSFRCEGIYRCLRTEEKSKWE